MEATLPRSAAPNVAAPIRPTAAPGTLATANAPSVIVPFMFVVTGMMSLCTGAVWLCFRPDVLSTYHYNQYVVALTHVFTLGFITTIIMGAMYQLVPVALETKLYSEKLAKWHFAFHVVGVAGVVWNFWVWDMKQVGHFGSAVAVGIVLFAINLGRTLARIPRWNVIAAGVASALFWLVLTMLAGLYAAASKSWNFSPFSHLAFMHGHAHLGGLGFFSMMIVSVSYKLVPMFALSDIQNERRAWASVLLLNAGLAGLFTTIILASRWKLAFALVVIAALVLYGLEMRAILRARKRRVLDWGLRAFIAALSLFTITGALASVLCWPGLRMTEFTAQLENVYGFVFLAGVVTPAILGMLYKIVPFLAWFHSYSKEIGRCKVPALADLYSERIQIAGFALYALALAAVTVATALQNEAGVRWGCVVLVASLALFAVNMGLIIRHFFRPRVEPLVLPGQAKKRAAA
ncbi:MAG: hypothetical protein HZA90_28685 [Verrucomicrobia bacterium]|nr:hypothetical protein [Verrucomicrobiota bacterium]